MQYTLRTDEEKESVLLSNAESGLLTRTDTAALRLVAKGVPQPSWPEELRTISGSEKAVAASGPGSEYWLP
jgi:hypothetical protein